MRISFDEAFALEPVYEFRLRRKAAPSERRARYSWLWRLFHPGLVRFLRRLEVWRPAESIPEPKAFLPAALAVIPNMTELEWNDATSVSVVAVLLWLFRTHDWAFIGETIGFGERPKPGDSPPPNAVEFAGILINLSKALDYTMPELLERRVEGFYLCIAALKDQRQKEEKAAEAEKETGQEQVQRVALPLIKRDPNAGESALDRAIREADEATARGENAAMPTAPPEAAGG